MRTKKSDNIGVILISTIIMFLTLYGFMKMFIVCTTVVIEKPTKTVEKIKIEKRMPTVIDKKYPEKIADSTENETETNELIFESNEAPYDECEMEIIYSVVQSEANGADYYAKALVAQCFLQACVDTGMEPHDVRNDYYYGGCEHDIEDNTIQAVNDVFCQGYRPCEENIKYFYAPDTCYSEWHEMQRYVFSYGGHRFFAERS